MCDNSFALLFICSKKLLYNVHNLHLTHKDTANCRFLEIFYNLIIYIIYNKRLGSFGTNVAYEYKN